MGAFVKAILMSSALMSLICFTGFFKLYRICHFSIIIFLGYRFGIEIVASATVFVGYVSIIIITIPYYLGTAIAFTSLHLYVLRTVPSPRPNWWCYSPCLMRSLITRGIYIIIPTSILYLFIFVIQALFIRLLFGI